MARPNHLERRRTIKNDAGSPRRQLRERFPRNKRSDGTVFTKQSIAKRKAARRSPRRSK